MPQTPLPLSAPVGFARCGRVRWKRIGRGWDALCELLSDVGFVPGLQVGFGIPPAAPSHVPLRAGLALDLAPLRVHEVKSQPGMGRGMKES